MLPLKYQEPENLHLARSQRICTRENPHGREMKKETGGNEWGKGIRAEVEGRKHVSKSQYV